jgi:hypothetical protein
MSLHLKILFFITYTQGVFQSLGIPFSILKLIQEVYILAIFFVFFKFKKVSFKYGFFIYGYLLVAFFSALYNDDSLASALLYTRFHLYAFLIFLLSISYKWKYEEIRDQYMFFKKLIVLQILYAFYEIFIIRDIQEEIVGTITRSGGELATVLPLVGLCFLFVEYLYKPNKKVLALCAGLFLIGFASAKRGIIFYFPITMIIIYLLFIKYEKISIIRKMPQIALVSLSALALFIIGISNNDSLNSGGSIDSSYAVKYASSYTTGKSFDGKIIGRIGASLEVLYRTGTNGVKDLLGFGPKIMMGKSGDFDFYKIDYGIVGWTKEVISVGWLGMIFYWVFYCKIFVNINKKRRVYRNSGFSQLYLTIVAFFIVFMLMFFTYSVTFSVSGTLTFYFMLFAGVLLNQKTNKLIIENKAKLNEINSVRS